jgi:hypothetical protein
MATQGSRRAWQYGAGPSGANSLLPVSTPRLGASEVVVTLAAKRRSSRGDTWT